MGKQETPLSAFPHLVTTANYIAGLQRPSGALPWFDGGITDPWDHVEALMGLTIHGEWQASIKALQWLADQQRADGAWFAAYNDARVVDDSRAETNFVAYVATGLWHFFLVSGQREVLQKFWPMVSRAIEFVLDQQADTGEIYWAVNKHKDADQYKEEDKDALVTGCSSIYKSLECAINIAHELGQARPNWRLARHRLGDALLNRPKRFDRTWPTKARYSMDWFYPVLCGVIEGEAAQQRLRARWDTFVKVGIGCRCVADQPWVTVAESCELVMACQAAGLSERAQDIFDCLNQHQLADGSWWTGYVFNEQIYWPDERPTWTAAAVLLAADALHHLTPASRLFTSVTNTP